jgi:hypothetical protein
LERAVGVGDCEVKDHRRTVRNCPEAFAHEADLHAEMADREAPTTA